MLILNCGNRNNNVVCFVRLDRPFFFFFFFLGFSVFLAARNRPTLYTPYTRKLQRSNPDFCVLCLFFSLDGHAGRYRSPPGQPNPKTTVQKHFKSILIVIIIFFFFFLRKRFRFIVVSSSFSYPKPAPTKTDRIFVITRV